MSIEEAQIDTIITNTKINISTTVKAKARVNITSPIIITTEIPEIKEIWEKIEIIEITETREIQEIKGIIVIEETTMITIITDTEETDHLAEMIMEIEEESAVDLWRIGVKANLLQIKEAH